MPKGKVIRFDEMRGYGFIAPDGGGDDVFIHANDLEFDERLLGQGVLVEFEVEQGDRGLKASHIRMINPSTVRPDGPLAESSSWHHHNDLTGDVLTMKELLDEITEILLEAAPSLTAEQIVRVRQCIVQIAHTHGWVSAR